MDTLLIVNWCVFFPLMFQSRELQPCVFIGGLLNGNWLCNFEQMNALQGKYTLHYRKYISGLWPCALMMWL